jgi:hypothetical protein
LAVSDDLLARKRPCGNCPWRLDAPVGEFSPARYRKLAACAADMSSVLFTCHKSTEAQPVVCAGFLSVGADHNLAVRMALITFRLQQQDRSGGVALHPSFRAMAIAQGVPPDDPALTQCRD